MFSSFTKKKKKNRSSQSCHHRPSYSTSLSTTLHRAHVTTSRFRRMHMPNTSRQAGKHVANAPCLLTSLRLFDLTFGAPLWPQFRHGLLLSAPLAAVSQVDSSTFSAASDICNTLFSVVYVKRALVPPAPQNEYRATIVRKTRVNITGATRHESD